MVRILILKRLHDLSDERIEYPLLDRMSSQRFCGLTHSARIPDRNTVWVFENRIGQEGASALFDAVQQQLERQGYIARCEQLIDATMVPAQKQHFTKEDKEILDQDAVPADWSPARRPQKDVDATWAKQHGKSHPGYKLTVNADKRYKLIRSLGIGCTKFGMTLMAATYNLKRLVYLKEAQIAPF